MIKRLLSCLVVLFLFFGVLVPSVSAQGKTRVYFFWSVTCPHCEEEKPWLESLTKKYDWLEVREYEVNKASNLRLWQNVAQKLGVISGGTPFTVVGDKSVTGFFDEASTGKEIETLILKAHEENWPDVVASLIKPEKEKPEIKPLEPKPIPESFKLPLLGELKTKNLSLPALTVVIGLLDGFNPCAMWALLFLISLLLGMKDRKRMWLLGSAFIFTSGLVYFLIMAAWLNLFLFVGLILWVRLAIGVFALVAGGYNLRRWWRDREGGCAAETSEKQQKTFSRLKEVASNRNLGLALLGIISLAVAVNLVELMCSAGLPAIYTSILAMNQLPAWQYYLYMFGYIVVFMLDDMIVFVVAMITLRAVGVESKYANWSRFIGGLLMFLIGLAMVFKPEWLRFG
jgi:thiol-disulfide isomerase/thioredoxin